LQGLAIRYTNWHPQYSTDEKIIYKDLVKIVAKSTALELASIRR